MCCEWNNDRSALIPRNLSWSEKFLVVYMSMHLEKQHARKKRRSPALPDLSPKLITHDEMVILHGNFPFKIYLLLKGKRRCLKTEIIAFSWSSNSFILPNLIKLRRVSVFHVNSSLYCQYPCTKALFISKDYNFKPYWALSKINSTSKRVFK